MSVMTCVNGNNAEREALKQYSDVDCKHIILHLTGPVPIDLEVSAMDCCL